MSQEWVHSSCFMTMDHFHRDPEALITDDLTGSLGCGGLTALGFCSMKTQNSQVLCLSLVCVPLPKWGLVRGGIWKAALEDLNGVCRSGILGWPGCAPSWDLSLKLFPRVSFFFCLPAPLLPATYS